MTVAPRPISAAHLNPRRAPSFSARIAFAVGDLAKLPYPPYVFNVVIDETSLCQRASPTPADEAIRVARPLGGVVYRDNASPANAEADSSPRSRSRATSVIQ